MKRTSLLLSLTLLILGGGFYVYWSLQPPTPAALKKRSIAEPVPPPFATTQSIGKLQPGEGSWLKEFDEETGTLTRQFRASEYVPQQNGTVRVTQPEVWFYGANSQRIHLTGVDGEIVVKDMPDLTAKAKDNSPATPPSRGMLNHVNIEMFSAASAPGAPDEVMTTQDIQFDNDTLLITTESFIDSTGAVIPGDQVPVHVRGKYDFDGRGLSMRWNDRDGRLETLKIRHGEQLTIKDASAFSGLPSARSSAAAPPGAGPLPASALSEMLVSADKFAAAQVIKSDKAPTTRPRRAARGQPRAKAQTTSGPTPYLAVFNDNVRITQGELVLATSDRMEVDFLQKSDARPTTAPNTTQPASGSGAAENHPARGPVSSSVAQAVPTNQPSPSTDSASQPTTRSAQPPTVVRWTGELTIIPAPPDRHQPLENGAAVVSLFGKPVHIVRQLPEQKKREEIHGAAVVYHTIDGSVSLGSSPETPKVIINEFAEGNPDPIKTIVTASLDHVAANHVAILGGEGHMIVPADENAPDKGNLDARWERGAKVYLVGGAAGESREVAVRQLDLAGNVDVEHPQLSMKSQALSLFFDPDETAATRPTTRRARAASGPTTTPASGRPQMELKRVLATTDVHTVLTDSEGKHQTIDGQQLELLTTRGPGGEIQPHHVNAEGQVHAFDAEQDLRTRRLELTLRSPSSPTSAPSNPSQGPATGPADKGKVELEKMLAIGEVFASSSNGSSASGDEMQVTMIDGEPHVRLSSASGNARVIDEKKNIVTGPLITAQTKRQLAHVEGPGSVHAIMADPKGSNPRPVLITWKNRADLNGPANSVDADGQIEFNTTEPDGRLIESRGDRVHIDLEEKTTPAPQAPALAGDVHPDASPAAHRDVAAQSRPSAPATSPANPVASATAANPMGQKQVKAVTLEGNAGVYSTLFDAQNHLLQGRAMEGPKIIYQATGSAQQPARSIIVPAEGRMLLQDHQAPEQRADNDTGNGINSGRGDTAFHWLKQFVYSEDQHRAVMNGDVAIVYRSLDGKEEPVLLKAAVVTANFDPAKPSPANNATNATRPSTRSSGDSAMQIRSIVADADANSRATVTRGNDELSALQIQYFPATHQMIATGTPSQPAVFTSPTGVGNQTAVRLVWDTVTWHINVTGGNVQGRGRGR